MRAALRVCLECGAGVSAPWTSREVPLFDIVNVQNWPAALAVVEDRLDRGRVAGLSFLICWRSTVEVQRPRKTKVGGSTPPASTMPGSVSGRRRPLYGRNRCSFHLPASNLAVIVQWQGTALVRRERAFDPP
jgi:hypothetical protein